MRDTLGTAATGAWGAGVIKSVDATLLPANASPRGLNSALALSQTGLPYVQKRKGLTCLTSTPLTGSGAILGQHDYVEVSTGTRRHLCTTATQIAVKGVDGVFSVLTGTLTSATPPDFTTANSMAFIFNGTDAVKVRGTTVENVGIVRPVVATMSGATGAAGSHNGTYELRVAYKNTNTGHLSSASDTATATVVATNDQIDWSDVPVSPDAQVDARVLLIRNVATQAQFYVAGEIADNTTTTATTNVADTALVTVAPTRTNRNPPPSGVKYCAVYRGRLVVSDGEAIYWSKIDEPEAFDTFAADLVDSSGDPITGLLAHQDLLLILKDDRTFSLTGDLGGAYQMSMVDTNVGCLAHRTLVCARDAAYWWSRHGIVRFTGAAVERIGMTTYGDPSDRVSMSNASLAQAVVHDERGSIYFAVPGIGQSRNTLILPWSYMSGVLESDGWDPMDAASLGMAIDGTGVLQPTLGNYAGQVFQLWSANNDGVASGTVTGTFTAGSLPLTTITDGTAAFDTTGGALVERKITFLDDDGALVTTVRPRITANTATTLTFTPDIGFTVGATYRYIIGGPDFEFDTPWRTFGDSWVKKRFEYAFFQFKGFDYGSGVSIDMDFDDDDLNINEKRRTFTHARTGTTFDDAIWDTDIWDDVASVTLRKRIARTGRSWRMRFLNREANEPFALLLVGVQAVGQTVKV